MPSHEGVMRNSGRVPTILNLWKWTVWFTPRGQNPW